MKSSTLYSSVLRLGLIAGGVGFIIVVFGFMSDAKRVIRFGTAVFLCCLVAWGLGNGAAFVVGFIQNGRERGLKRSFVEEPGWMMLYVVLMIFLFWVGFYVGWGVMGLLRGH